ncbi:hypothetical protein N7468_010270 [Penicillium chermesinum]|uniref:Uncharacterized protein n=1 Tax=Penicillium chermesinum TaxID=63820 RepID=A0A9W9TC31_9EURO|nr:uncharacterized protein N7468_010270 [Penicillium chermesinum]KAJ5217262.1 hypothetical protein N7468_010270 [Penicillium chermesinum]KAJ6171123.1 hypothetical protein N7470_000190 [Penicillium chermesinum]
MWMMQVADVPRNAPFSIDEGSQNVIKYRKAPKRRDRLPLFLNDSQLVTAPCSTPAAYDIQDGKVNMGRQEA